MKIGITFDLKNTSLARPDLPDDFQEEFDSPDTIEAIAGVLRARGHEVVFLGDGPEMVRRVLAEPPDFVFNIAEGQGVGRSREARVPAVLEMLGIPYTGSDPFTLAVTLDKDAAKRLAASAGVPVPGGVVLSPGQPLPDVALTYPLIVKPAWEGSSKGIRGTSIVDSPAELARMIASLQSAHQQPVLIEEYIQGEELTVGVVGNSPPRILGIMRVLPTLPTERFIYSLEVKRDFRRMVRYECPAQLSPEATAAVEEMVRRAWAILGCRDVSRLDFRLRGTTPYFLEVNPLPGLNPDSGDLVLMAQLAGWSYPQLVGAIFDAAAARHAAAATTVPV